MSDGQKFEYIKQFIDICCDGNLSDGDIEKSVIILNKLYEDGKYRHRYSEIARYLGTKPTADIIEVLSDSLNRIENSYAYKKLTEEGSNAERIKVASEKLFDTLDLEMYRLSREKGVEEKLNTIKFGSDIGEIIQNAQELIETACKEADTASTTAEKASEDAKRVNSQSMSTLGVFTAIMFAFTGGFSLIGGSFSAIHEVNRNEMLLMFSLVLFVGCLLSDIIYALMRFLERMNINSKDTNKTTPTNTVENSKGSKVNDNEEKERRDPQESCENSKSENSKNGIYACVEKMKNKYMKMTWTERVVFYNIIVALIIVVLLVFNYNCATPHWKNSNDNVVAPITVHNQSVIDDEISITVGATNP